MMERCQVIMTEHLDIEVERCFKAVSFLEMVSLSGRRVLLPEGNSGTWEKFCLSGKYGKTSQAKPYTGTLHVQRSTLHIERSTLNFKHSTSPAPSVGPLLRVLSKC
jgi:hypothetical protein